ncbi:PREDICTED: uncharacterized protein LOC105563565 [Vollenhovia emeryi]|uniref:uncharacterized protein LOC105563565 n=1 Tax=Vollenhovia emeryi TaxID=411798 RepID=UPI0005F3951E|nr:PREDICTED: uncharacterized protein LOC105563565 [Vollenhovia emeryi]XP_011870648.1 PREDICTED: uncharacterized protein LOC105563565 [Vollenhovia emeryi]XP_011870658.1 PREDICTED: uncharacterized protein LOC105563565 [Vollenhovia emeryi]
MFLSGFCGLMYGFIISVFCTNMYAVCFASAGSFLPMALMNGSFWPLEGMPKVLYWISCLLPTTLPCISVRGIIFKGSSISDSEVYIGVLISLGWIMLFFVVTLLGIRMKS